MEKSAPDRNRTTPRVRQMLVSRLQAIRDTAILALNVNAPPQSHRCSAAEPAYYWRRLFDILICLALGNVKPVSVYEGYPDFSISFFLLLSPEANINQRLGAHKCLIRRHFP